MDNDSQNMIKYDLYDPCDSSKFLTVILYRRPDHKSLFYTSIAYFCKTQ